MNKNNLRILFRTSGGKAVKKELGLGHVYRCLNLSECLRQNESYFLIEDYGGVKKIIKNRKIDKVSFMRKNIDLNSDINETVDLIKRKKIDIVIVDKYNVKLRYLIRLKKYAKIVLISDLHRINYPADLVINGFIGFNSAIRKNKYGTTCLLGPKFQILNKTFADTIIRKNKPYKLLVTFGGFDEKNITKILLEELLNKKIKSRIILGPATKKSAEIRKMTKSHGKHISIIQETGNMRNEISNAQYGLCSGGLTTYEFSSQKIPFAIICQVKHQLITAREWEKRGVAVNLGLVSRNTKNKLRLFLKSIIQNKTFSSTHQKSFVDGRGITRVSREILKLK